MPASTGHVVAIIDETAANVLFRKCFNALPDLVLPDIEQGGSAGPVSITLRARNIVLKTPIIGSGVSPVDFLGSTHDPNIAFGHVPFSAGAVLGAELHFGSQTLSSSVPVGASVDAAGRASVAVVNRPADFLATLTLQPRPIFLDFSGNRNALTTAVRNALNGVDISPFPGVQHLPPAMINAAVEVAGQLFDRVSQMLAVALSAALSNLLHNMRLTLACPIPRDVPISLPGGGVVHVVFSGIQLQIDDNKVTLTATFF